MKRIEFVCQMNGFIGRKAKASFRPLSLKRKRNGVEICFDRPQEATGDLNLYFRFISLNCWAEETNDSSFVRVSKFSGETRTEGDSLMNCYWGHIKAPAVYGHLQEIVSMSIKCWTINLFCCCCDFRTKVRISFILLQIGNRKLEITILGAFFKLF